MNKSISIFLVLISVICFSAFSQDLSPTPKKNFEWKNLEEMPWYHGIPKLNQKDSIAILSPELERGLYFPGLDGQKLSKSFLGEIPTVYNMPIKKPEGEFPILVHVPDENVNYTIRIKEY
jgi:hypothetical protein